MLFAQVVFRVERIQMSYAARTFLNVVRPADTSTGRGVGAGRLFCGGYALHQRVHDDNSTP